MVIRDSFLRPRWGPVREAETAESGSHDDTGPGVRPVNQEKLAALQSLSADFLQFRKFRSLHVRRLLCLQDELRGLELELADLELEDENESRMQIVLAKTGANWSNTVGRLSRAIQSNC
jgi:hypothetical protein